MVPTCWLMMGRFLILVFFFFFNDTATTEIYTLSLHDALPISPCRLTTCRDFSRRPAGRPRRDRKSTRLNSSHGYISYAVFCLKKKTTPCNVRTTHTKTTNGTGPRAHPTRR